jgi:hypothetical protein
MILLTPKGLNVPGVTKLVLGNVTWPHFSFRFFETFCEHASRNKLHGSTSFIIFGPTDQKLWVFENFKRSLGRAGMCWSQPTRVDHTCKKMRAVGNRKILKERSLGHPRRAGRRPLIAGRPRPTVYQIVDWNPFFHFFDICLFIFGVMKNGLGILGNWVYNTSIFWTLFLHLEVWNLPFVMELGDFIFFQNFWLKLEYTWPSYPPLEFSFMKKRNH